MCLLKSVFTSELCINYTKNICTTFFWCILALTLSLNVRDRLERSSEGRREEEEGREGRNITIYVLLYICAFSLVHLCIDIV